MSLAPPWRPNGTKLKPSRRARRKIATAASLSAEQRLEPPFRAVKVTGALFHTQGGLAIDGTGRVKRRDGGLFPNLFAAGGAAAGVSGSTAAGYLSGNGLLTATVLGRAAGQAAAAAH